MVGSSCTASLAIPSTFVETTSASCSAGRHSSPANASRAEQPRRPAVNQGDDPQNTAKARFLWSKRQPIAGSLAETYLQRRGIVCPPAVMLGFLPARDPHPPAMIAAYGSATEPEPGQLAIPQTRSVQLT